MFKRSITSIILLLLFISLGTGQTQRWLYTYNGQANGTDYANKIVYGANNNLYTIGRSQGSGTGVDYIVISLTNTGTMRWVYRFDSLPNVLDYGNDVVYGSDGNLYTAGRAFDGNFAVISLNDSGNERWVFVDTTIDKDGKANSLVYGLDGNIYAAGYTSENYSNLNFTVISLFNHIASLKWIYSKDGIAHNWDEATDVVCGPDNNIYACGFIQDSVAHRDFAVVSISADSGRQKWFYSYGGPVNGGDEASALVYGSDGNIYVCGYTYTTNGNNAELTVMSFDTNGTRNWMYTYNCTANLKDYGFAIVYGQDNNIYVAGRSESVYSGNYDMVVVSLTNTGSERWVYRYTGPGYYWDEAYSLTYGADGNIYVAGYSRQATGVTDFTVISLTNTGSERWIYRHNGPANSEDVAWDVVYGNDGNIYATGYRTGVNSGQDITVISLTSNSGVEENCEPMTALRSPLKIYPNPAKTYFVVNGPWSMDHRTIKIYDVTGKMVKEVRSKKQEARISTDGIKNGVYFIKVTTPLSLRGSETTAAISQSIIQKLVVTK